MKKIIIISMLLTVVSPLFGAEIVVSKFVETPNEKIYLKDIAQLKGCNSKWKNILLTYISTPGITVELPAEYIKARLKLKGVPVEKLKISIPKVVKIKRKSIKISKKDLIAIATHCIKNNNPWHKRLKIVKVIPANELILPVGRLSYFCQLERTPLGSFSMPIIFKINGEIVARTWVMVKTILNTPVVIAAYPIRRGEIITKDKLRVIKKDVSRLPAGIFVSKDGVVGKRARVNIGANKIIYRSMVEIPPLIKRGQKVTIVAESETLKITAPGRAKEDGRLGDIIKVENTLSKKVITGKVVDSQTVKVKF